MSHLLMRLAICASNPDGGAFMFLNTSRYCRALSVFFGSFMTIFLTRRAISWLVAFGYFVTIFSILAHSVSDTFFQNAICHIAIDLSVRSCPIPVPVVPVVCPYIAFASFPVIVCPVELL